MNAADRRRYQSRTQQFLTFAAVIASKNGIFTLPRLLFIHGGAPFVIAYTTLTVSVAIPVMQLESVLGQFTGAGNIGIFDTVPGMRGLGHTMTFYFTLGMTIFVTECSYSTVFLASLFRSTLPWADCSHFRPSDSCYVPMRKMVLCSSVQEHIMQRYPHSRETQGRPVTNGSTTLLVPESVYSNFSAVGCDNGTQSATRLFFDSRVLRLSADGHDVVHPEIAIAMAALWLLVFAATRNGLQNAEYAVYVIASLTITTLILMLVNSLALKYSDRGMNLLVRAPLSGVVSYELWRDALKVTISNIGIFSGGFLSVARFNIFKTKIGTFSTIVALMQLISSLLYGLLFYAHVGFLSSVKDTDIEHILESVDIEHVIMPETLTILDTTRFWCTVYFTWLLANALGYMMIGPEVVLEAVVFEFPGFAKFRNELRLAACFCFYFLGLCLTTTSGPHIIKLLLPNIDVIAALSLLLEVLVIVRIYGIHRVMVDYHTMTGHYPSLMTRLSWTFGVPLQLTMLLVIEVVQPSPEAYRGVHFSYFAKLFGIWIIVAAVSFIPTYLFALLTVHPWEKIMAPAMTWLPEDKAANREYRALLRECGYASRKGRSLSALPDQPSLATSGQGSVAVGASRGETVTVAETIDPREMVGTTERSVSFAPDVITTPRYSENFNELLDQQFGLHSSRAPSRDATSEAGLLDDASSTIQIKLPQYETNIDAVPVSVFAKEDVEEIRKIIGNVHTALGTLSPRDAGFAEKIALGNCESGKRDAQLPLANNTKKAADKGERRRSSTAAAVALPLPPVRPPEGDARIAKDAAKKRDRKQSAVPLPPAAVLHLPECDVKTSIAGAAGTMESRQGLAATPEPATFVAQPTEGGVKISGEQAAHSAIDTQSLSEKHAQHSLSKERSGQKKRKHKWSSPSRTQKKRGSRQLSKSKKSAGKKRKLSGSESADANQGKDSVETSPKDSAKDSAVASPVKINFKGSPKS
ncbi:hypothetical protein HPB49_011439 [Dermacentor silvarum]|uniref:Uncharacterized protein n=1 Tax=Dermacentor silvarum TaxID=543639 RepID=A0ACB8CEZ7_DERSI|nr:sodium- and chloride-dependent glycine transporter 2 [Dermacentor silvarum]KAH7941261.1 hypothetical protein HPB49_011439 [Dermacentor silvarum]